MRSLWLLLGAAALLSPAAALGDDITPGDVDRSIVRPADVDKETSPGERDTKTARGQLDTNVHPGQRDTNVKPGEVDTATTRDDVHK